MNGKRDAAGLTFDELDAGGLPPLRPCRRCGGRFFYCGAGGSFPWTLRILS